MIGAIAMGTQAAIGIGQTIAGLAQKKPEIPDYEIPSEIYANMTDAEYWSFMGLPEAQKRSFIDNTQRAGTMAMQQAGTRKGGLGLIAGVQQQQQDAYSQLLSADVGARMENLKGFWNMRNVMAGEKSKEQEWNLNKIMAERAEINELRGAGMQNVMGALGSAAGWDAMSDGQLFAGVEDFFSKENRGLRKSERGLKRDIRKNSFGGVDDFGFGGTSIA